MTTATAHAPADPLANPIEWAWGMLVKLVTVWGTAMLIAGGLYYTFGSLASVFSFMDPLGTYWAYVLAVLGAYAVYSVYRAVRDGVWYNTFEVLDTSETRAALFEAASTPATILIVALIISELIA